MRQRGQAGEVASTDLEGNLRLRLFGPFSLVDPAGKEIRLPVGKMRALVAYLALNPDLRHPRGKLANLLWGDQNEARARNSLNQCLFRIRSMLGPYAIALQADRHSVMLDSGLIDVDAVALQRLLIGDAAALALALETYRGELLSDVITKEANFEEWAASQREIHATLMDSALSRLAEAQLAAGDAYGAITTARQALAMDQLSEPAHRLLIRAYVAAGQNHAALRQYQACRDVLRRELGIEPEAATVALGRDVKARRGAVIAQEQPESVRAQTLDLNTVHNGGTEPSSHRKPSIAVLPFDNLSGDPGQEFFADGMAEDIIAALSRYRWFFVIARGSSFSYKSRPSDAADAATVARELGVRYVLEGSVRRSGGKLRAGVQLIDVETGHFIWADHFDRRIEDIFQVQDVISHEIARAIERELADAERQRALRQTPDSLDAWETYQRGIWHLAQYTRENSVEGRRLFRRAVELDPNFALAYARIAYAEVSAALLGFPETPGCTLDDTLAAARQSVTLDGRDAMSHFALGRVWSRRQEHDLAIAELQTAVDINPSFASAHFGLAQAKYASGQIEPIVSLVETAIRLSPKDPGMWSFLSVGARALLSMERYEEAVQWSRRAVQLPNTELGRASIALISALGHLGRTAEVRPIIAMVRRRHPEFSVSAVLKGPLHHFKIVDQRNHILEGLRKAGLPAI